MKKLIGLLVCAIFALNMFAFVQPVKAVIPSGTLDITEFNLSGIKTGTGLGSQDFVTTVSQIIRVAMGLLGIVAVVIVLIGGFTWMTAGGNDEKISEAKKWIFAGIIGLAIILSAYAITSFVVAGLVGATTGTTATTP